ncbi:hypothetical protein [Noviluteimonas gilva]|nr:hypothetical protein [Lysobacter gilvus]
MEPNRAIEILERQKGATGELRALGSSDPAFAKWKRDTEIAIQRIFGDSSRHFTDFSKISYSLGAWSTGTPDYKFHEAFLQGLDKAEAILASMVDEINEYEVGPEEQTDRPDYLSLIEQVCLRFHSMARQLRSRHAKRPTLEIDDEYDVQDLLHAAFKLHFDDIRAEEWTPSYAGGSSRVDFLLKQERIVVEVKKTRSSMSMSDLGAQILIDIARYERHPDCGLLVCFIYDPEGRIGNPVGLERDLESHSGKLKVRVIVGPKGH